MKRFVLPVMAVVFASGAALASDDPMANYYDNTIVITNATGATSVYIQKDGTFHETLPDGTPVSGTWAIKDGTTCFYVPEVEAHCVPAEHHAVGDHWDVPATDGTLEKAALVAGR